MAGRWREVIREEVGKCDVSCEGGGWDIEEEEREGEGDEKGGSKRE